MDQRIASHKLFLERRKTAGKLLQKAQKQVDDTADALQQLRDIHAVIVLNQSNKMLDKAKIQKLDKAYSSLIKELENINKRKEDWEKGLTEFLAGTLTKLEEALPTSQNKQMYDYSTVKEGNITTNLFTLFKYSTDTNMRQVLKKKNKGGKQEDREGDDEEDDMSD